MRTGLAFAEVEALPARPLTHLPERARPRSRAEADYMLRYLTCACDGVCDV
jgi:hypothetical protein